MPGIGDIKARLTIDIEKWSSNLKQAQRELRKSSRNLSSIADSINKNITLPFVAASGAGVKFAIDLEKSFSKIENLVGVTGDELQNIKQSVKEVSKETGIFQSELADAAFVITSAGQKGSEAMRNLEASAKASSIGLGRQSEIARVATAAVTAYGEANITSAQAIDQLTAIVKEGNLEASELAPSLGKVLPIAAQLGVSFSELGANIATFSRLGLTAGESVTGLKSLLSNIIKPGKKASEELAKVGTSMDEVRASIKEKGLAIALQDLIKKFEGNKEGLARLFPNVEGLTNALATAGLQGKEYVRIVKSIENSNGIVNEGFERLSQSAGFKFKQALTNLQNEAIELGATLLPVVSKILDGFNATVGVINDMDSATKKAIITATAFASGLGIAFKGVSMMQQGIMAVNNIILLYISNTQKATKITKLFNFVAKSSAIGFLVAGIAAAVAIFAKYKAQAKEATRVQESLNDVTKIAQKEIAGQKAETESLVKVLEDERSARDDKLRALARLNDISPKYFGNLQLENDHVVGLTAAYNSYIESLLRTAKIRAAQEKIDALASSLIDLQNELAEAETNAGGTVNMFANLMGLGSADLLTSVFIGLTEVHAKNSATRLKKEIGKVEEEMRALAKLSFDLSGITEGGSTPTGNTTPTESPKPNNGNNSSIQDNSGGGKKKKSIIGTLQEEATLLAQNLEPLPMKLFQIGSNGEEMNIKLTESMAVANEEVKILADNIDLLTAGYATFGEAALIAAGNMKQMAISGETSLKKLGKAALDSAKDFVRAKIFEGVSSVVSDALSKFGVFGLAIGAAAGAGAVVLFNNVLSKIKVPAFAEGGIVTGPTLGLIGEKPGSKGEAIIPLEKMGSILNMVAPSRQLQVTGKIRGRDIYLANEKAGQDLARTKGS